MGKPQHISILPTLLISCAAQLHTVSLSLTGLVSLHPGFHSQDFSHIPETNIEESKQRDAEEEISSDAQTTNFAVHL